MWCNAPRGVGGHLPAAKPELSVIVLCPAASNVLLSHALGLGAACSALAQGLGCSCAVHMRGRMERAALALCPLSLLF